MNCKYATALSLVGWCQTASMYCTAQQEAFCKQKVAIGEKQEREKQEPHGGREMSELNELAKDIHENAVAHGWWVEERSFGEIIALCHSELSEALEEYRNGRPRIYHVCSDTELPCAEGCCEYYRYRQDGTCEAGDMLDKPEGIAVELADCIIRILDYCGKAGIDIDEAIRIKHEYNKTRPYRHGGKVI